MEKTVTENVAAETPVVPKPARRGGLLIVAVVALVILAGLGGATWFLLPRYLRGGTAKAAPAVDAPVKATVPLGAVVVNLRGETRRYLRIGVSLGVPAPSDGRDIEAQRSQLQDLLIAVLSAADPETLVSPEGKEAIKQTLLSRIRSELQLAKVGRVYFTEFVIQ
jgi:flagellar FliL protein